MKGPEAPQGVKIVHQKNAWMVQIKIPCMRICDRTLEKSQFHAFFKIYNFDANNVDAIVAMNLKLDWIMQ